MDCMLSFFKVAKLDSISGRENATILNSGIIPTGKRPIAIVTTLGQNLSPSIARQRITM